MSEEVISRVDDLVRKNNIKYKDQKEQKAYEQALKEYEKHNQKQLAKQYANIVKEGNKKAIQKAKQIKAATKKKTKKKSSVLQVPKPDRNVQKVKPKLSQAQIEMFNKTVEARAERLLQEQQLQKLNKQLNEQRKRTKLHQLNEKCKKMLSKSHERIVPARGVSTQKMGILKQMQERAFGEIMELDNIINNLVDKANDNKNGKRIQRPQSSYNIKSKPLPPQPAFNENDEDYQEEIGFGKEIIEVKGDNSDEQYQSGLQQGHFDNFLSLNTIIFEKSTEQLLSMNYLPL